jgi:histidine ammonia-lyase
MVNVRMDGDSGGVLGVGELEPFVLGERRLGVADVVEVARGRRGCVLSGDDGIRTGLGRGQAIVAERIARGERLYGITTGYGDSVVQEIPLEQVDTLSALLVRYHGCGVGEPFPAELALGMVLIRAATFSSGYSAVRVELIERLLDLVSHRIAPVIPGVGSVGASGDLTPLSYIAAVVSGEREVWYRGERMPARTALEACGLAPLTLAPKEGLALINGTAVMAALACFAIERARKFARLACTLTAMASDATVGNPAHFDPRIFAAKPHPGCVEVADLIRADLEGGSRPDPIPRLQDRYSIRCAPHVIGVLLDTLPWAERIVEIEINGANDNPLVDPESGEFLHGGNFYGGHLVAVLDTLKVAVANVAELLERQLLLLCQPSASNGLPVNLTGAAPERRASHHGFKGAQITASAIVAEMLKLSMPASVFSRSTENHNQDKVSMGTIAGRDCLKILDQADLVGAISLIACAQAVELRGLDSCGVASRRMVEALRPHVSFVEDDRSLDVDIEALAAMIGDWELGATSSVEAITTNG